MNTLSLKCPRCGEAALVPTERQGIEIDACPSCRGVWLDRGELDKLIERSVALHAPSGYERDDDDDDDDRWRRGHAPGPRHGHDRPRSRGSWLSDLFD